MELTEDRVIHRFIKEISEYEKGGEFYNQIIPADAQAYAIYPEGSAKAGLYYVLGDDKHTYTEIRDGKGSKQSAKEYPVFSVKDVNNIDAKAEQTYVENEFANTREDLTNLVTVETSRATGAEKAISDVITDETARAALREDEIEKALVAEVKRAQTAESELNTSLSAETTRATTKENTIETNLDQEINRAQSAETEIANNLNSEITRAKEKENALSTSLTNEINRATNKESELEQNISTLTTDLNNEIARAKDVEIELEADLNAHINDVNNPHSVTKAQLGLENVNNTSDINKPISTATQQALDKKADKANTLAGYDIQDAYTKAEVDNKLTAIYRFKGNVNTYNDLPNKDLTVGDVYNALDTGANYGWTGNSWDKLGENIDLSPYALKTELPTKVSELQNDAGYLTQHQDISEKADVSYVNTELAKKQDAGDYALLSDIPTKTSELINDSGYLTEIPEEFLTVEEASIVYATQDEIANKQDTLTFDEVPTADSTNPVYSKGIKTLTDAKQDIINGNNGELLYHNGTNVFSQPLMNEGFVVATTADLETCKNSAPSFEEVFNNWLKFSHLNGVDNAKPEELSAWTYDADINTVVQPLNTESYCGFVSPKSYSSYDIKVRLYSTGDDDDQIGMVAAFATDANGKQHTLSFIRSPWNNTGTYKWICKVDHCTYDMGSTAYNQILLADKTSTITIPSSAATTNWGTSLIGTGTVIHMTRNGNVFTAACSQFNSSTIDENTRITIDLDQLSDTYPVLNNFKGASSWGYSTLSQPYSMYENINVTDPDGYICDLTSNSVLQFDSKTSTWVKMNDVIPATTLGAGRLSYNKKTGKLFYCTGSVVFQIATNADI